MINSDYSAALDAATLRHLTSTSQYVVGLADHINRLDSSSRLLGPMSAPPMRAWNASLQAKPTPRRLMVASVAGDNVSAIISGEALTNPLSDSEVPVVIERAHAAVVEPRVGAAAARSRMLADLAC